MNFEFPRISFNKNSGCYGLEFKLPKELKDIGLPENSRKGLEKLANSFFDEFQVKKQDIQDLAGMEKAR